MDWNNTFLFTKPMVKPTLYAYQILFLIKFVLYGKQDFMVVLTNTNKRYSFTQEYFDMRSIFDSCVYVC